MSLWERPSSSDRQSGRPTRDRARRGQRDLGSEKVSHEQLATAMEQMDVDEKAKFMAMLSTGHSSRAIDSEGPRAARDDHLPCPAQSGRKRRTRNRRRPQQQQQFKVGGRDSDDSEDSNECDLADERNDADVRRQPVRPALHQRMQSSYLHTSGSSHADSCILLKQNEGMSEEAAASARDRRLPFSAVFNPTNQAEPKPQSSSLWSPQPVPKQSSKTMFVRVPHEQTGQASSYMQDESKSSSRPRRTRRRSAKSPEAVTSLPPAGESLQRTGKGLGQGKQATVRNRSHKPQQFGRSVKTTAPAEMLFRQQLFSKDRAAGAESNFKYKDSTAIEQTSSLFDIEDEQSPLGHTSARGCPSFLEEDPQADMDPDQGMSIAVEQQSAKQQGPSKNPLLLPRSHRTGLTTTAMSSGNDRQHRSKRSHGCDGHATPAVHMGKVLPDAHISIATVDAGQRQSLAMGESNNGTNVVSVSAQKDPPSVGDKKKEEKKKKVLTPITALPIYEHREKILRHVDQYRVTCIEGETGCGKSTTVPQLLLHHCRENGERANIVVTQPRRVAAMTLARHVADQLEEDVGKTVGYQISRDSRVCDTTAIRYVTTGFLLQALVSSPQQFSRFTHIVLDEVHERSVDADLLSLLIKMMVERFQEAKLVVMSATMQGNVFSQYFSEACHLDSPVQTIAVGAKRYPVEEVFLDDVDRLLSCAEEVHQPDDRNRKHSRVVKGRAKRKYDLHHLWESALRKFRSGAEKAPERNANVMSNLLSLCAGLVLSIATPNEAILVFLPGQQDIFNLHDEICALRPSLVEQEDEHLSVFVLHSQIPRQDQEAVFEPPQPGRSHIVLATNMAESSVTIPAVRFVVDFGLHKQIIYDPKKRVSRLALCWTSRASAIQRAGRTGRVFPGTVVRLYTRAFFEQMREFDLPEMERVPLDKLLLQARELAEKVAPKGEKAMPPSQLLSLAVQPPSLEHMQAAVHLLYDVGALAAPDECAPVTLIGSVGMKLPIDLALTRLVLFALAFDCTCDGVAMAASLALAQDTFTLPSMHVQGCTYTFVDSLRKSLHSRFAFDDGQYSEPIMYSNLFRSWVAFRQKMSEPRATAPDANQKSAKAASEQVARRLKHSRKQLAVSFSHTWAVSWQRLPHLEEGVVDIATRLLPVVPKHCPAHRQLQALESLQSYSSSGHRSTTFVPGLEPDYAGIEFCTDYNKLKFLLMGAFSNHLMVGEINCKSKANDQRRNMRMTKTMNNISSSGLCPERTLFASDVPINLRGEELSKTLQLICQPTAVVPGQNPEHVFVECAEDESEQLSMDSTSGHPESTGGREGSGGLSQAASVEAHDSADLLHGARKPIASEHSVSSAVKDKEAIGAAASKQGKAQLVLWRLTPASLRSASRRIELLAGWKMLKDLPMSAHLLCQMRESGTKVRLPRVPDQGTASSKGWRSGPVGTQAPPSDEAITASLVDRNQRSVVDNMVTINGRAQPYAFSWTMADDVEEKKMEVKFGARQNPPSNAQDCCAHRLQHTFLSVAAFRQEIAKDKYSFLIAKGVTAFSPEYMPIDAAPLASRSPDAHPLDHFMLLVFLPRHFDVQFGIDMCHNSLHSMRFLNHSFVFDPPVAASVLSMINKLRQSISEMIATTRALENLFFHQEEIGMRLVPQLLQLSLRANCDKGRCLGGIKSVQVQAGSSRADDDGSCLVSDLNDSPTTALLYPPFNLP